MKRQNVTAKYRIEQHNAKKKGKLQMASGLSHLGSA